MAPSRSLGVRQFNILIRKIPYGIMLRRIMVVEVPKEYISIVY